MGPQSTVSHHEDHSRPPQSGRGRLRLWWTSSGTSQDPGVPRPQQGGGIRRVRPLGILQHPARRPGHPPLTSSTFPELQTKRLVVVSNYFSFCFKKHNFESVIK